MASPTEVEVKLAVNDVEGTSKRLRDLGFSVSREREFESNTLYDRTDRQLRNAGMLMRLRKAGDRNVLTWKGPSDPGRHKSRPERETSVGSIDTLAEIFGHLGYEPVFRYEKFRTEFRRSGEEGSVVLDETPIGNYLELEGPADWIDATAAELGFRSGDYIVDSYGGLYLKWREHNGVQRNDMVFSS